MTDDFANFVQHVPYSIGLSGLSPIVNFGSVLGGDGDMASQLGQAAQANGANGVGPSSKDTAGDEAPKKKRKHAETVSVTASVSAPAVVTAAKEKDKDDDKEKKEKEKKVKDPNAPKKPPSAYILFQNAARAEMKKENPTMQYKDLQNKIVEKWSKMTPEQKDVSNVSRAYATMKRLRGGVVFSHGTRHIS